MTSDKIIKRVADSRGWNSHRQVHLTDLTRTGDISDDTVVRHPEWGYAISRHAGGTGAAHVAMTRLKKLWPLLAFKVVNTRDDDTVAWDAVIYARLKVEANE